MLKISKGQKYQILGRKRVKNQRIKCQNFQKSKKNNKELGDSEPRINWNKTKNIYDYTIEKIYEIRYRFNIAKNEPNNLEVKTFKRS